MKNKFLLPVLLVSLLFIAGCGGFGADRAVACAEGQNCRYYTGTQGVDIILDRPPNMLYYRSIDATNTRDGNAIQLNVRVHNRGASDAYGAVFLSGFGPTFEVTRIYGDGTELPINIRGFGDSCGFSFGSFGPLPNFNLNCGGIGVRGAGDRRTINFDFSQMNRAFGWDLPEGVRVGIQQTGNHWGFNLALDGFQLNTLYHGKLLMSLIYGNFNFENLNGMTYTLRGDNPEFPGGGDDYKQFLVQMKGSWPSGTDEINIPYQVRSCYAYTTFVSPMICVDPDPWSGDRGVCRANQDIAMSNQGAPVAVTRVSQRNTGRSVVMDFEVRNVGNGRVWEVGSLERCSPYYPETGTGRNHHDVVYVGFVMIDDTFIDCTQRTIRLNNGVGRFTCTYNFADEFISGSAYVTPLRMELWYGYEQNINNNLRVRRLS
ncbi:MAG: hypothetical protein ACMXX9_00685 [Candidatus Woesearchaeota archaeon]